jgi:hypothetical protein
LVAGIVMRAMIFTRPWVDAHGRDARSVAGLERIRVKLARVSAGQAMLVIEDDACSPVRSLPSATFDTIDSLARLLEAEIVGRRAEVGGVALELRYPAY